MPRRIVCHAVAMQQMGNSELACSHLAKKAHDVDSGYDGHLREVNAWVYDKWGWPAIWVSTGTSLKQLVVWECRLKTVSRFGFPLPVRGWHSTFRIVKQPCH